MKKLTSALAFGVSNRYGYYAIPLINAERSLAARLKLSGLKIYAKQLIRIIY